MDTINYFIAESDLPQQTSDQAYGPLNASQYNVTSLFTGGSNPMCYAVVNGRVLIVQQKDNENRINLILKPDTTGYGLSISYFIYRGLIKSDFLVQSDNGYSVRPQGSDDSDFIKNLRKGQNPDSALNLYDDLSDDYLILDLFNSEDYQFANIKQGESFGHFDSQSSYGFEIMLDDLFFNPSLQLARINSNLIDTTSQDNPEVGKLQVLNYVDPVAYYGLFVHPNFSVGTNQTPSSVTMDDVYQFINKFYTKNSIYLDIRDENGYPIDWFTDSPQNIRFTTDGTSTTPSNEVTYRDEYSFPIKILNVGFSGSQTNTKGQNYFPLNVALPTQENETALLVLNSGYWLKFSDDLPEDVNFATCITSSGWSDDKAFLILAINDSETIVPISTYINISLANYVNINALSNQIPNNNDNNDADLSGDENDISTLFYNSGLFPFQS